MCSSNIRLYYSYLCLAFFLRRRAATSDKVHPGQAVPEGKSDTFVVQPPAAPATGAATAAALEEGKPAGPPPVTPRAVTGIFKTTTPITHF